MISAPGHEAVQCNVSVRGFTSKWNPRGTQTPKTDGMLRSVVDRGQVIETVEERAPRLSAHESRYAHGGLNERNAVSIRQRIPQHRL